jgi:DNA-binding IscR family transcriptional regulator
MIEGDPDKITLLNIYEEIEGPLPDKHCLLEAPFCNGNDCILGGLLEKVNREVREYLSGTRLSQLKVVYKQRRNENE